ncbi:hypothetical protein [Lentzea sp. NBRC 102530]|uniref:hypothetical protein n=1 Tax=Lentzea sp. NBRC 102530 TaxID=3032201 RepID=UPI0024A15D7D|nr:hypothetical protein [Lentzea sp. NBRC 102530]GLY55363.1 hypothetical protein Lesp01_90180 [Lentzea sp. NBRC 102530]
MSEYTLRGGYVEAMQFSFSDLRLPESFCGRDFDSDGDPETNKYVCAVRSMPGGAWRELEDGDWIVRFSDGYRIYPEDEFNVLFEPLV